MKRFAFFFIMFALAAASAEAGTSFLKSIEEAKKEAKKNNQLIFVDFFAAWCGWCHKFEREVVPSEAFQSAVKNKVLLRVDTEDGKEGTQMSRQFGVTNLPTFFLMTPDFEIAGIMRGYAPAAPFVKELLRLENEYVAFTKKVKAESTIKDPQKRLELAREFHNRRSFAEAEKRLKKLVAVKDIKADVRDPAYLSLAQTLAAQGRWDEAAVTLKKLLSLTSKGESAEQARYFLARIYLDQRNLEAALEQLKEFRNLFPDSQYRPDVDFLIPYIENAMSRAQ